MLAWVIKDDLVEITSDLRRVVPGLTRTLTGDPFAIELDNGSVVPADLLSEGTVLALGLFTKLRAPDRPRLLLVDDIDRGLDIGAQARLVEVLRRDPELQLVCTTYSPYLVDPRRARSSSHGSSIAWRSIFPSRHVATWLGTGESAVPPGILDDTDFPCADHLGSGRSFDSPAITDDVARLHAKRREAVTQQKLVAWRIIASWRDGHKHYRAAGSGEGERSSADATALLRV